VDDFAVRFAAWIIDTLLPIWIEEMIRVIWPDSPVTLEVIRRKQERDNGG
jgi:hypothetical protein